MTPDEVYMSIEAENFRKEARHRSNVWIAWHTAAWSRAKKMPGLKEVLMPAKAKDLKPEEAKVRRQEFEESKDKWHKLQR